MRTRLVAALVAALAVVGLSAPAEASHQRSAGQRRPPECWVSSCSTTPSGTPMHRCSGTMISATTLLTAGHCTVGHRLGTGVVQRERHHRLGYPSTGGFTGTPETFPGYTRHRPEHRRRRSRPPRLSSRIRNVVDRFRRRARLARDTARPAERELHRRRLRPAGHPPDRRWPTASDSRAGQAHQPAQRADRRLQHPSPGAPGTGGGTCFGDSGGPILIKTHTIVAVTSFGLNANCAGGGFGFRVDTQAVHDFIGL